MTAAIVHLIATNFYGGPEKQVLEHAVRLEKSGRFSCRLVSFREGGRENEFLLRAGERGLSSHALDTANPFDPRVIARLAGLLRREQAALLVAHGYKANVIGRLASWRAGIPLLAVSRGWTAESLRIRAYEALDRIFLNWADHVVAVSEGQRDKLLARRLAAGRISVVRNAYHGSPALARAGLLRAVCGPLAKDRPLVVAAGRLSPEKDFSTLIRAAAEVSRQARAIFVVFGEGVLRRQLTDEIRRHGLEETFLLPGFRRDFTALLPQADIFVLPSLTEGLPNVALEASAAGLPVVATAVGGTPEVVVDGISGYLVGPGDAHALGRRLLELLGDRELRRTMGQKGREHVGRAFCPVKQTEAYLDLYQRLIRQGDYKCSTC